jgi:hypothetical protein
MDCQAASIGYPNMSPLSFLAAIDNARGFRGAEYNNRTTAI